MPKLVDLTGKKYGRLTVVGPASSRLGPHRRWECVCRCGRKSTVSGAHLRSGNTTSCGCRKRETQRELPALTTKHGGAASREYRAWARMRTRCGNKNTHDWKDYGGRGIRVCARWRKFENFFADMGACPAGCSLDRIDVNGNYSPRNCRWATVEQQVNNRRNTRWITWRGVRMTMTQWARKKGRSAGWLHKRLSRYTLAKAMAPFGDVIQYEVTEAR